MFINIIKSYRDIVAICDAELIGKYFEEGQFQLDVKESFYKGDKKSEEEILNTINDMQKEDATFNIVGKKATETALKSGIISKDSIKTIQDIPFALLLK